MRLHITIQDKRNNHSHEIIDCGYQPHDMGTGGGEKNLMYKKQ